MQRLIRLFPLWAILLSLVAMYLPAPFVALREAIVPLLVVIMFGMGMTLTVADFRAVLRRPATIALGVLLQFTIMPLAAWLISHGLGLEAALLVGMVLVGSAPGGTASNVICYLARGNVALSISMTLASTLLAFLLTPLLTWIYAGQSVPVPLWPMLFSVAKIVLAPVLLGVALNTVLRQRLRPLQDVFPLLSVVAIVLIIAIIVALNRDRLGSVGSMVVIAVVLHNLTGLGAGYLAARCLRLDETTARTLAIEVGMQNSGLAVALALQHFAALAALPGALFSIWHNLSGSLLAAWWSGSSHPREADMP